MTIRPAGEVERATIIDDDEIELELRALVRNAKEKLGVQERAALEDSKRVGERLGEANVPEMFYERDRGLPIQEDVRA